MRAERVRGRPHRGDRRLGTNVITTADVGDGATMGVVSTVKRPVRAGGAAVESPALIIRGCGEA